MVSVRRVDVAAGIEVRQVERHKVEDRRGKRACGQPEDTRHRRDPLPEHRNDERREQRGVEEREQQLDIVHNVAVARRNEGGQDADQHPDDGHDLADLEIVVIGTVAADVGLPDVVGEHRVE